MKTYQSPRNFLVSFRLIIRLPSLLFRRNRFLTAVIVLRIRRLIRIRTGTAGRTARTVRSNPARLFQIDPVGQLSQHRLVNPQFPQPFTRQLRPSPRRFVPNHRKVRSTAKVLSDGYCGVQIKNHVPPATGHEHGLARFL